MRARRVCIDIRDTYIYNWLEYDVINLRQAFRVAKEDIIGRSLIIHVNGVFIYSIGIL